MTIFIDMDGVITDFRGWITTYLPDLTEDDWRYTAEPWDVMTENIDVCYLEQEPLHLLEHFNYLYNNLPNVKFLSAIPKSWFDDEEKKYISTTNKLKWLALHIDNFKEEDAIFTRGAAGKVQYCNPGDVLYDDRKDTCETWCHRGGIGICVEGRKTD